MSVSSRLLSGAAAAGLIVTLSACSGLTGGSDSPAEQPSTEQSTTAPSPEPQAAQLDEDALTELLQGVSLEGTTMNAQTVAPGEMQGGFDAFRQAKIEPAECKDIVLKQTAERDPNLPSAMAFSEDNRFSATAVSYDSPEAAEQELTQAVENSQNCGDISVDVGGQKLQLSLNASDIQVPGADRAIVMEMKVPAVDDGSLFTVSAQAGTTILSGADMRDSDQKASAAVVEAIVKKYNDTHSG